MGASTDSGSQTEGGDNVDCAATTTVKNGDDANSGCNTKASNLDDEKKSQGKRDEGKQQPCSDKSTVENKDATVGSKKRPREDDDEEEEVEDDENDEQEDREEEEEDEGGEQLDKNSEHSNSNSNTKNDKESTATQETKKPSLPLKPVKKARTAYFIFADEKRPEIQAAHPGEPIGVIARVTGQLWSKLSEEQRLPYQQQSAQERERAAKELERYHQQLEQLELHPDNPIESSNGTNPSNHTLVLPIARMKKICKLDPEVKNLSKEAMTLICKSAELVVASLGVQASKVARLQNRRKLLPEDVAQVCATRERFAFLRQDIQDLVREQDKNKATAATTSGKKPSEAEQAATAGSKPLTAYFGTTNQRRKEEQ